MKLLFLCVFLVGSFAVGYGLPDQIRIGGLFDGRDPLDEIAFRYSIEAINTNRMALPKTRLIGSIEKLSSPHDSVYAARRVCQMFRTGVTAVLGPGYPTTAGHVQSMCDAVEVPHIETRWDSSFRPPEFSINLHPHPSSLSKAYLDVITAWEWRVFTILYENEDSLIRLQDILAISAQPRYKIMVRRLPQEEDYRPVLKEMLRKDECRIVLDCSTEKIGSIMKQAQQVGLVTSKQAYFITSLDLHTVDMDDYKYAGTNITGLRMIDPNDSNIASVLNEWVYGESRYGRNLHLTYRNLRTETALIYDAVQLYAKALHELDRSREVTVQSLNCESSDTWTHGVSLMNYMKMVEMEGLTGLIRFDTQGLRTHFHLDIVQLTKGGLSFIGTWNSQAGANFTHLQQTSVKQVIDSLQNKTLTITSILSQPYFMYKESSDNLVGNNRFEGFVVDIIDEISKLLGFNYTFKVVDDGNWGTINRETGEWNGMIKELLEKKADLAIGDLSINYERQETVDFTMPFMNTGISILYKKPQKKPPNLFSFLSPFSVEVWIYMCTAYLGVSLLLFVVARITPFEWNNPHPCNQNPDILENQFTCLNSMWFTIGSLMQQGSDVAPKSTSTRMIAGTWWFFTLIMISSYTANLAAFLTVERMESPIQSMDDLGKQTKIRYGGVKSGSTVAFFRNSQIPEYKRMWTFMESIQPSVFVQNNAEGIERVQRSNGAYAFLMESSSIEFYTERKCDLAQIGGPIDSKGYGIAMRKGSLYRAALTQAVLHLQETNRLLILKNKWWKEKRGGGSCAEDSNKPSTVAAELGLANVGGVFVVLIGGILIASIISVCELAWETRKSSDEEEGSFWQRLMQELRYTMRFSSNTRPTHRSEHHATPSST